MLNLINENEVPRYNKFPRSEVRQFAYDTLTEFFANSNIGDVFEITGSPKTTNDELRNIEKVAQALRTELYYMKRRDDAKVFRRKTRLFIERVEPWKQIN